MSMDVAKAKVVAMCEGNPGALNVLCSVIQSAGAEQALQVFEVMEDMNLRGPRIWLAFKDASRQDLNLMMERVLSRDPSLVETVNANCFGNGPRATISGACHR